MTDEQQQALASAIAEICETMALDDKEVLEGLAYTLIAALDTFKTPALNLEVAGYSLRVAKDY